MKRVLILAGESSGDLHGSLLMNQMKILMEDIDFKGIGGTLMEEEGLKAVRHIRDMNIMGFTEIVVHLPFFYRTMKELESLVDSWYPDLVILIDYPGFNLRFTPYIKHKNIPLMYYISPKLWAWHSSRVKRIQNYVDRMVVLFDFEKEFYRQHGIEADFVGHPLLDTVVPSEEREVFRALLGASSSVPLIGLLPGSRLQEIDRILPSMVDAVKVVRQKQGQVIAALGCVSEIENDHYERYVRGSDIMLLRDKTYDIMAYADVLVVTSGTATLEAGILGTPMVIVYRTSTLSYYIGKTLVKIPDIGLINIVAGSRIVPELLQNEMSPNNIAHHVLRFLNDPCLREEVTTALGKARMKLGERGAAARAARIAVEMMDG